MSRKRNAASSPRKDGKNLTAKEVSGLVKSMAPKARSPYALYLHEQHPIQQSRLKLEGLGSSELQRAVVAAVSQAWRDMPAAEKQVWEEKSSEEKRRRQEAISNLKSSWQDPGSIKESEPATAHPNKAQMAIGSYIMEDNLAWVGSGSWSVKAYHKTSMSSAQVVKYRLGDKEAFSREVQVMVELEKEAHKNHKFVSEVYLQCYQRTSEESQSLALIFECLPRLDQVLQQDGALELPFFRSAAQQLGLALKQLHCLKIAHGDIKPAALFVSREQNLLKLARYSLAVELPQKGSLDVMRYSAGFRAPELWVPVSEAQVSEKSEAWAFAITLIEMFTACHPLQNFKDVWKLDATLIPGLPGFLTSLVLPLLRQTPEQRMTVQDFMDQGLALRLPSDQAKKSAAASSAHQCPELQFDAVR